MLKRFFTIVLLFVAVISNAEGHFQFKGIEINGPLKSVMDQLTNHGFSQVDLLEQGGIMSGWFTGNEVKLYILTTPISKTVKSIIVEYNKITPWSVNKSRYDELAGMLQGKYGDPVENVCDVCDEYDPFHELYMDRGRMYKKYVCDQGSIIIEVNGKGHILLYYIDNANTILNSQEEASEL